MTKYICRDNGDKQPKPQEFHNAVFEFEEKLIRQALAEANNKPTAAARLLGLNSHQALLAMLDNRHKKLRDELGITKRVRRKTIIKR
jgi:transcriptional regulator with GAF, ATPase, and Fis domain